MELEEDLVPSVGRAQSEPSPVSQASSSSQLRSRQEEELKKIVITVLFKAPMNLLLDERSGLEFRRALKGEEWFKARGLTVKDLTNYWSSIWSKGIKINNKLEKIRSFGPLFEAIGNQKFTSPYDQIKRMTKKKFYKKAIFSTFQKFLRESDFLKTWVEKLYKPGKNKHHEQATFSDEQKKQMFFDCIDYIIERYTHPEDFIKSRK